MTHPRSHTTFYCTSKSNLIVDLLSDLKKGKRGAIAKAITIVENDQKETKKLLKTIFKVMYLKILVIPALLESLVQLELEKVPSSIKLPYL